MKPWQAATATLICAMPFWLAWSAYRASEAADKLPEIRLPKPWPKVEMEGEITAIVPPVNGPGAQGWFAQRKTFRVQAADCRRDLCFVGDDDYFEVERCVGLVAVVRGVEVRRGSDWFLVVEGVRVK